MAWPWRCWRVAFVVVVVGALVASLSSASASSLGGARSSDLYGFSQSHTSCTAQVVVTLTGSSPHSSGTVGGYDTACVGEVADIVVYGAGGAALTSVSTVLVASLTVVTFSPAVSGPSAVGAAAVIANLGVQAVLQVPGGPDVSGALVVTSDNWWNWCADVTVTTVSATPVPWSYSLVLDGSLSARLDNDPSKPLNPLTGVPLNIWNGSPGLPGSWDLASKTVTVSGAGWYATVDASNPHTFGLCVERDTPPPPTPVTCTIVGGNTWPSGFQLNFQVTTTSVNSTPWTCTFTFPDPATSPASPAGSVVQVYNGAWCFSGSTLTVSSNATWMMVDNNSPYNGGFQGAIPATAGPNGPNC